MSSLRLHRSLAALFLVLCFAPSATAECRLDSKDGAERVSPGATVGSGEGVWIWQARPGDELRCDAAGFEPVDLWCGEGCGGEVRVTLLPARSVVLASSSATLVPTEAVTVEWRRLGAPGETTHLLATRTVALLDGKAQIPVASGDDRVLRWIPPDGAPESVFVPQGNGLETPEIAVSEPRAGGEVFGFVESTDGEPALLYIQGVTDPSIRSPLTLGDFGEFSLRGLPDGVYRPRAVYPGGAASVGDEVEVVAGQTTELIPWRVEQPSVSETVPSLEAKGDAVATLVGRVTIADDEPAADLCIEARSGDSEDVSDDVSDAGETPSTTETDAAGRFELALPEAGRWQLHFLTSSGFPVREQEVEVTEGVNEQDFDLGDAAIRVRIVRGDGEPITEAVHVEVTRGRGGDVARTGTMRPDLRDGSADDVAELLLLDLTYGSYQVSGYTESGWASLQPARALPNKDAPIVSAELVLEKSERVAIVRMPDGSPAKDVLVALDRRQVFPGRPGEFSLTGANERSEIRIMPDTDYVGVCRKVGDLERIEIDLQPATAQAVLIPSRERMPPTGRYLGILEGLPGSDCAMPIALQWQPFRDEHGRDRILLPGLAPGVYTLRPLRGEPRELVVPGPPVPLGADVATGKDKG